LTTPPDTALSVGLPPSFKELHGTSREIAEERHAENPQRFKTRI